MAKKDEGKCTKFMDDVDAESCLVQVAGNLKIFCDLKKFEKKVEEEDDEVENA
jgi:hypothetical protein